MPLHSLIQAKVQGYEAVGFRGGLFFHSIDGLMLDALASNRQGRC